MARKDSPDWAAILRDYRTGTYSNRELGRLHHVSESTIRKRAENRPKEWQRDLAAAVARETDNQLARDAAGAQYAQESAHRAHLPPARVRATPGASGAPAAPGSVKGYDPAIPLPADDGMIVAAAARRGADVVRGHRAAAERLKAQFDRLSVLVSRKLTLLERDLELDNAIEEANQVAYEGQPQGGALRREARGFGLIEGAELLDTMARAFSRLTAAERQAYGLDGKVGTTPIGLEEGRGVTTPEQRQAAIANLRVRAAAAAPVPDAGRVH